jgi:hypothetical protein
MNSSRLKHTPCSIRIWPCETTLGAL